MKRLMKVGNVCAFLSAVIMCVHGNAPTIQANEPSPRSEQPRQGQPPSKLSMDVVTNARGELRGAVVNADTAPSANAKVVLTMVSSKESQQATTDANGRYLFNNVRPGL